LPVILIVFYRNIERNLLLVCGVAIIVGFTLIKGIGYKEAEQLYGVRVGPFRIADFIELSGLGIAIAAALKRRVAAQSSRASSAGVSAELISKDDQPR
jgi:hypothetical protein